MKLTKGKISKLYAKNRQSVKRKKNGKKNTNKSKTFRKKRNINLANKTLKQVNFRKNGHNNNTAPEYDNSKEGGYRMPYKNNKKKNKSLSNQPNEIEMTPLGESVDNSLQNQDVVPQVDNSSFIAPSSEAVSDSSIVQPLGDISPANETPVLEEPLVETPLPLVEEPLVETPLPDAVEEPLVETPVLEEPLVETPVLEEPLVETPVLEEPLVETPVVEEPLAVAQVPQDNDSIIGKSFKIILDYSLEKLASEIKNNKNSENIIQNGFNANKIAANSMASSEEPVVEPVVETPVPLVEEPVVETPPPAVEEPAGETQSLPSSGGKRRKTRKFKLTNKNKKTRTKH